MKKLIVSMTVLAFFLTAALCFGEERATKKEAEAMVKAGVEFMKANGKAKAINEFHNNKGKFMDLNKGLFIFLYDFSGKCLAQGANAAMVGKDLIGLKDPDGKPVVKDLIDIAKTKGKGWYDYKWVNPANKKLEIKTTYVESVEGMMIGCGYYRPL